MAKQVRVAFCLDGLLCDTAGHKQLWAKKFEGDSHLEDGPFYASLKAYDDVDWFSTAVLDWESFCFVERSATLRLPTNAWLKRAGFQLARTTVVMSSIKRYDARLHEIDVLIDSDLSTIENLKWERVHPIAGYYLDRASGQTLRDIVRRVNEDFCGST